MTKVIGIIGKAGAGKDTVADHLRAKYGFVRGQFARLLKDIVCDVYGWDRELIETLEYKEEIPLLPDGTPQCPGPLHREGHRVYPGGMTRRQVLQHIGTEGFRYCADDTWVRAEVRFLDDQGKLLGSMPEGLVFADVRFINEAKAIRRLGGEVWRVSKIGGPGTDSADHQSETEMDLIKEDHAIEAAHGQIPLLLAMVDALL